MIFGAVQFYFGRQWWSRRSFLPSAWCLNAALTQRTLGNRWRKETRFYNKFWGRTCSDSSLSVHFILLKVLQISVQRRGQSLEHFQFCLWIKNVVSILCRNRKWSWRNTGARGGFTFSGTQGEFTREGGGFKSVPFTPLGPVNMWQISFRLNTGVCQNAFYVSIYKKPHQTRPVCEGPQPAPPHSVAECECELFVCLFCLNRKEKTKRHRPQSPEEVTGWGAYRVVRWPPFASMVSPPLTTAL